MTDTGRVAAWYDSNVGFEHGRLENGRVEYSISLRVIFQCLESLTESEAGGNRKKMRILDLGGGTGRYAIELSKLGHEVTLSDISQSELDRAATYAQESGVSLAAIIQADARDVRNHPSSVFKVEFYDMILCQGPLYHLLEKQERLQLLADCAAMARPGGFVLVAFITKFAHLRDIAQRDPERLYTESEYYAEYLTSGRYTRNSQIQSHHLDPRELRNLFEYHESTPTDYGEKVALHLERVIACEGFLGGGLSAKINSMSDDAAYEAWVDTLMHFAEDAHILGAADHLLAVARRI